MNRVLRLQETLAEAIEEAIESAEVVQITKGAEKPVSDESVPEAPNSEAPIAKTPEAEDAVAGEASSAGQDTPAPEVSEAVPAETAEAVTATPAEANVVSLDGSDPAASEVPGVNLEHLRMAEALLFAASEPLSEEALKSSLPEGADVSQLVSELQSIYEKRGVTLVCVAEKWQFRTAPDLAFLLRKEKPEQKRLSRAAIETLSIIAYHQPVTRAEIEDIRGVALSKGTLDTLMEVGWVKIRGRKRTPGRPVTYGTTEAFLVQFGLENVGHLPGMEELKAAGFLEAMPPSGLEVPTPSDQLAPDEDPYNGEEEGADLATGGSDPFIPGSSEE